MPDIGVAYSSNRQLATSYAQLAMEYGVALRRSLHLVGHGRHDQALSPPDWRTPSIPYSLSPSILATQGGTRPARNRSLLTSERRLLPDRCRLLFTVSGFDF